MRGVRDVNDPTQVSEFARLSAAATKHHCGPGSTKESLILDNSFNPSGVVLIDAVERRKSGLGDGIPTIVRVRF